MKLKKSLRTSLGLLCLICFGSTSAQSYWVYFKDKCDNSSTDYFDQNVCPEYVQAFSNYKVHGASRWLNALCVDLPDTFGIERWSFVQRIVKTSTGRNEALAQANDYAYGPSDYQVEMMRLDSLHRKGINGKGVLLALFDGGFMKVDSIPIFDSIRDQGRIIATYDFVKDSVLSFRESRHGMQVMALAGGQLEDSIVGAAPGVGFVLARTEDTESERHVEEFNWIRAMEWADSLGVDIIHSSLGYSLFDSLEGDYSYQDMDGRSTIITLAAERAAARGIFVTNSAGNSGNKPWRYITAPCDGKHVLCIGAVDSFEQLAEFSSVGPTADGRIKPDVVAMGHRATVPDEFGRMVRGSGTSFSGPLVAGLVACLIQAHPNKSNQQIFDAILQSADRFQNPDTMYGYGIPDAVLADSILSSWPDFVRTLATPSQRPNIYPNPTQGWLTVEGGIGCPYEVIQHNGATVLHGRFSNWINFIDLRGLMPGIYYLRLFTDQGFTVQKVLLE